MTSPVLTQQFRDDFERPDSETLGSGWSELGSGAFKIRSGAAVPDGTATQAAVTATAMGAADHWAEMEIGNVYGGSFVGLIIAAPTMASGGLSATGSYYVLMLSGSTGTNMTIRRKEPNATTLTTLKSGNAPVDARTDGTKWRLERMGNTLRGYINGTLVVEVDDTAVPTTQRRVGMHTAGGTADVLRIAYVRGGTLTAPAPVTDVTPPSVPVGLYTSAPSATGVTLNWTASADAVGVARYIVRRNGVVVADQVTGTSWADSGLSPSTSYSYAVRAVDAAGNQSADSSPVSFTTPAAPTDPTPTTGRLVDRWDGAALVRQRVDRWDGTQLVPLTID